MSLAAKVKRFLDAHRICYQLHSHERTETLCQAAKACNVLPEQLLRTVVMQDHRGIVVVTLLANSKLNFHALRKVLRRNLEICSQEKADKIFYDCEPMSHPPIAQPYGLLTIVDDKVFQSPCVFFEPGTHTCLVQLSQDDFSFLMSNALRGPVSVPLSDESAHCHWDRHVKTKSKKEQTRTVFLDNSLPKDFYGGVLPKVVQDIITLAKDPQGESKELANILQTDPLLCEGIRLFAQLKGHDVHDNNVALCESIRTILDFDTVSHIVRGCKGTQHFRVTKEGPLGLKAIWAHALYASQVCFEVAEQASIKLDPTTAYLCGLFQNIGFLLYGHLFPPEFRLLNKWVSMDPKKSVTLFEQRLLGLGQAQLSGCSHAQMGGWLIDKWNLPEAVVTCTYRHHEQHYHGAYCEYVTLLQAVNQCMLEFGLGDGQGAFDWQSAQQQLGLGYDDIYSIATRVVQSQTTATLFPEAK